MKITKKDILIIALPFVILAAIYPFLPPQIPRQFSLTGQPTSYAAREFIFILGIVPFLIYKRYRSRRS